MAKAGMVTCECELIGISPISFSRVIQSKRDTGESHEAFEERTWRERLHTNAQGEIYIPGNALKNCLADTAKYLSESIPGQGKSKFTKHFKSGVMVVENLMLGIQTKDVEGERLFVPSDGRSGGGSRVWKIFPFVPEGWTAKGQVIIVDPLLTSRPEKIEEYLSHGGKFIGMGRWRPANGGLYGRFKVEKFRTL